MQDFASSQKRLVVAYLKRQHKPTTAVITMNKPDHIPQQHWDDMTDEEKRCIRNGHVWYYDTCERCGARKPDRTSMRTNIHLPSEDDYKRQKAKLSR